MPRSRTEDRPKGEGRRLQPDAGALRPARFGPRPAALSVAVDTGGTFTDFVFLARGRLRVFKLLSTPDDPARAILQGIVQGVVPSAGQVPGELRHGTTVGTNALLERKGARVVLLTTAGFEDVLVIGRQQRARLYDLDWTPPPPLVPPAMRLGVAERVAADGAVLTPLRSAEIARLVRAVRARRPEAIALCLLFAFRAPRHERQLSKALAAVAPVTASHALVPEIREYERTATVVVNAYLQPRMARYLQRLAAGARRRGSTMRLRVMQSSGGMIGAPTAAREPVRTVLSGPAGGVIGAHAVAALSGIHQALSFDMGGTSTDVALIDGRPALAREAQVTGLPLQLPMLDIHTVGSGGGSLARFDAAGALRVGPESAGADPGPIAYGRGGDQPTVTDAHVLLGRLDPAAFLGGALRLDAEHTARAVTAWLRRHRRGETPRQLAAGIVAVANAAMERALRLISIERGVDPRAFSLVAFGGAGGLHACELAAALQLKSVLVPIHPGALSALGILLSDVVRDFPRSLLWPASRPGLGPHLRAAFQALQRTAAAAMRREGFTPRQTELECTVLVRYVGQGFELELPWTPARPLAFLPAFHAAHRQRYGYADATRPLEVAGIRLRARGRTPAPDFPRARPRRHAARPSASRPVVCGSRRLTAAVFERSRLGAGAAFAGPALVSEYSASTFLPPGWHGRVDGVGNLLLKSDE